MWSNTTEDSVAAPDAHGSALASLYLSVTNFCNLSCNYCSADAGPDKTDHLALESALLSVEQWLDGLEQDAARLIFTGGEAIFWGFERLDAVCRAARQKAAARNIRLHLGIQSNGTAISEKFIDFCARWGVEPSFSLDGTPNLSNRHRGLGEKVFANLKKMQERGIAFGLIICLTREIVENIELVLDFLESNQFSKVRFNILGAPPGQRTIDSIDAEDIFHTKRVLYERAASAHPGALREYNVSRQIAWFDQALAAREPRKGHCEQERCDAGRKTAVLNPDGRWGMCVEKSMSDGLPLFGSMAELGVGADRFWHAHQPWSECQQCAARSICDHGCIAYHKGAHVGFEQECKATKKFWKYLVQVRLLHQEFIEAPAPAHRGAGKLLQPLMQLK